MVRQINKLLLVAALALSYVSVASCDGFIAGEGVNLHKIDHADATED